MQLVSSIESEEFNYKILPTLIYKTLITKYNKLVKRKRVGNMNNYLKEHYNLTIEDIIKRAKTVVNNRGNQFIISIEQNETINGTPIETLIRLIDFGNMNIKGLNLFNAAFRFVENKLKTFFGYYMIGGFNNVN